MTHPLVLDDSNAGLGASVVLYVPGGSGGIDPEPALRLIEQAGESIHRLEAWQETIQVQAGKLLYQIRHERAAFTADIEDLNHEIAALRREVAALQASLAEATIEKDRSTMLSEAARARAADADRRAFAAEKRAQTAETWLGRLQVIISSELSES